MMGVLSASFGAAGGLLQGMPTVEATSTSAKELEGGQDNVSLAQEGL
jgi:hypothetical protein